MLTVGPTIVKRTHAGTARDAPTHDAKDDVAEQERRGRVGARSTANVGPKSSQACSSRGAAVRCCCRRREARMETLVLVGIVPHPILFSS